jgi:hypothetical protein
MSLSSAGCLKVPGCCPIEELRVESSSFVGVSTELFSISDRVLSSLSSDWMEEVLVQ